MYVIMLLCYYVRYYVRTVQVLEHCHESFRKSRKYYIVLYGRLSNFDPEEGGGMQIWIDH